MEENEIQGPTDEQKLARLEELRKMKRLQELRLLREKASLQQEYDAKKSEVDALEAEEDADKPGYLETISLANAQGVSRDWADEAAGKVNEMKGGSYKGGRDNFRERDKKAEEENPKTYGATKLVSEALTSPIKLMMNPLTSGAYGGANGFVKSLGKADELTPESLANAEADGMIDAATSAVLTAYAPALLARFKDKGAAGKKALDKFIDDSPKLKSLVDAAKEKGGEVVDKAKEMVPDVKGGLKRIANKRAVKATGANLSMIKELDARGKLDETGQYLLEDGNLGRFKSSEKLRDDLADKGAELAKKTQPIYEQSKDSVIKATELEKRYRARARALQKDHSQSEIGDALERQANRIKKAIELNDEDALEAMIENGVNGNALGKLDLEFNPNALRKDRQKVSKNINWSSDATSQLANNESRMILREAEMEGIERVSPALRKENEAIFKELHKNNNAYDLAEHGAARSAKNNDVSATAKGFAAAEMIATGNPALVIAKATAVELAKRYGDQNIAITANQMANLMKMPKYSGLFEKAAKEKGVAGVVALHRLLYDRYPDYKEEAEKK